MIKSDNVNLIQVYRHIFWYVSICESRKNVMVEPPFSVPYWMSDWPARSSAFSMGVAILSTVRKAARLAV